MFHSHIDPFQHLYNSLLFLPKVSMDWLLIVVLQVMLQPSLSVLFTVEAEQTKYESKFGEDVVMGCRFQPKLSDSGTDLKVNWHWIGPDSVREVFRMDNWKANLATQDPDYRGRVRLLTEQLQNGLARIQVSKLRINDAGTYQCLVQTEEGTDYKAITLSVTAPYKAVTKRVEKVAEGDDVVLTCESEGYPECSVVWQDGHQRRINANTTAEPTPDQLSKVTSHIRIRSSEENNYTCIFANSGYSATFHIPDLPATPVKNDAVIVVLSIGVIMVAIIVAVLMYRRQKGFRTHSSRNTLVDGRGREKHNGNDEEITIFNEGCIEENLGVFLKAKYADVSLSAEVRHHRNAFGVEELPHRLQNNQGQSVNLQALLPEAGEILFLEGAPGSGKTTVANILVSSWTEGPTHALSNLLNLSTLTLLFYVDCSKVKGDLFQEITIQLSLTENISNEDELKTVLTGSGEVLLLLDGYTEGNQYFDESLRKFLMEKGKCRVLVMASPGHCPTLRALIGTEQVLQLQTQSMKS
ncbi:programmed cell death 1 ligand 1-like isoform X2 [Centropristis striata]|uniref:programmed cell death 1 ligand 1-like isoform X2 n=1 Tax=Centropristis striata TaxID=184440 RepID=UPI0027DFA71F|nr:programmed cell death 1 ligand 1-like isoform X2 [Centropristis striata]